MAVLTIHEPQMGNHLQNTGKKMPTVKIFRQQMSKHDNTKARNGQPLQYASNQRL